MRPLRNEQDTLDLLNGSFVSIPYTWLSRFSMLDLSHKEFVVLIQILGAIQVSGNEILSPQELGRLCRLPEREAGEILDGLMAKKYLAVVETSDPTGARIVRFDVTPLWRRVTEDADEPLADSPMNDRNLVSLFEQEFGRPLSGLECEQIRQWLDDSYPDWMLVEALREAVLANKCSFRYMDRILYDWQRNRIRTHQDLDHYRQSYRQRAQAREETAAASATTARRPSGTARGGTRKAPVTGTNTASRDERYSAFYELFPDA